MKLTLSSDAFRKSAQELIRKTGVTGKAVIRTQAGLASRDMMLATPPFSTAGQKTVSSRDKNIGELSIKKAVSKTCYIVSDEFFDYLLMRSSGSKTNVVIHHKRKDGVSIEFSIENMSTNLDTLLKYHKSQLDKYGRGGKRWRASPNSVRAKMCTNVTASGLMIERLQQNVGFHKASWAWGMARYLKKALPSWIRRHLKPSTGGVTEIDGGTFGIEITAIGKIPRNRVKATLGYVLSRRAKAMAYDLRRIIKGGRHQYTE